MMTSVSWPVKEVQHNAIMLGILFVAIVVVGFVQPSYTFSESVFLAEVCVRIFNPSQNEDLIFDIDLIIQPMTGTAGKFTV